MSKVIVIHVAADEVHEYPVKTFEEITVEDYIRIHDGQYDGEPTPDMLKRVFGIETRIGRVMKLKEVEGVVGAYQKLLADGAVKWKAAKGIKDVLAAEDEETGKPWTTQRAKQLLEEAQMNLFTFEVGGETFRVMQQIEVEGNYGQWLDLRSSTMAHKGTEAEIYPKVMTIFCPKKGEGYGVEREEGESIEAHEARFHKWIAERNTLFLQARMVDAIAACSFFFSSSTEFSAITHPVLTSFQQLRPQLNAPEHPSTVSAGDLTPS